MIHVRIKDHQHPYANETGILKSKQTCKGRMLFVFINTVNSLVEVSRDQIEILINRR